LDSDWVHRPVLVREVVDDLMVSPEGTYVDGTIGTGGHSLALGKRIVGRGRLIGLDRDPEAVALSRERLSSLGDRVHVVKGSYADLDEILETLGRGPVQGILLDLGMSSYQLERSGRGFSFSRSEPLDMRMDPDASVTAEDLLNRLPQQDLERILREYGEERRAKSIARSIVRERERRPIKTTFQLIALIRPLFPPASRTRGTHPATRTFQALRIAVNGELDNLRTFLGKVPRLLIPGGRLAILSYHSLEDRIVKHTFHEWEGHCTCPPGLPRCVCDRSPLFKRLRKGGLKPDPREIAMNPRARSAILRVAERV
jgi:16S rRNA (cytosine1402-N4)-methyltransferase